MFHILVKMSIDVHFTYSVNWHSHKKTTLHVRNNVPRKLRSIQGPSLVSYVMFTMTRPSILIFMLVHVVCQYSYIRTLIQDLYDKVALASSLFRIQAPAFICILSSLVLRSIWTIITAIWITKPQYTKIIYVYSRVTSKQSSYEIRTVHIVGKHSPFVLGVCLLCIRKCREHRHWSPLP
jgi:hypothetical protein